jgi:hypothetical protein
MKEGHQFSDSIEKAKREAAALHELIEDLSSRRPSELMKLNRPDSGFGAVQPLQQPSPPPRLTLPIHIGYINVVTASSYSSNAGIQLE